MMMMLMMMTGQLQEAAELFIRYNRLANDSKAHVYTVDLCTSFR